MRDRPGRSGLLPIAVAFAVVGSLLAACGRQAAPEPQAATDPLAVPPAGGEEAAPADLSLDIQEWQVPWENTRPRDPYVAPDGTVWFVGQVGDYLGHLDPESGELRRFPLPDGTGPHTATQS